MKQAIREKEGLTRKMTIHEKNEDSREKGGLTRKRRINEKWRINEKKED